MAEIKRVTLHPLKKDGTIDDSINLYPKTLSDGIVDRDGNEFEVQEKLVSGENIKTINNQSILGEGNIEIDLSDYFDKEESKETFYQYKDVDNLPDVTAEDASTLFRSRGKLYQVVKESDIQGIRIEVSKMSGEFEPLSSLVLEQDDVEDLIVAVYNYVETDAVTFEIDNPRILSLDVLSAKTCSIEALEVGNANLIITSVEDETVSKYLPIEVVEPEPVAKTITILPTDMPGSYDTSEAQFVVGDLTLGRCNVMKNNTLGIQFKKSAGYIKNVDACGLGITSIVLTTPETNVFGGTLYYSTSEIIYNDLPATSRAVDIAADSSETFTFPSGITHFFLKDTTGNAKYLTSIEVNYMADPREVSQAAPLLFSGLLGANNSETYVTREIAMADDVNKKVSVLNNRISKINQVEAGVEGVPSTREILSSIKIGSTEYNLQNLRLMFGKSYDEGMEDIIFMFIISPTVTHDLITTLNTTLTELGLSTISSPGQIPNAIKTIAASEAWAVIGVDAVEQLFTNLVLYSTKGMLFDSGLGLVTPLGLSIGQKAVTYSVQSNFEALPQAKYTFTTIAEWLPSMDVNIVVV